MNEELLDFKNCHGKNFKECEYDDCYFNHEGLCAIDEIDIVDFIV